MSANRLVRPLPLLPHARFVGRTAYLEPGDSINAAIALLGPTAQLPAAVQLGPGTYRETVASAAAPETLVIVVPPNLVLAGAGLSQTTIVGQVECLGLNGGQEDDRYATLKGLSIEGTLSGSDRLGRLTVVLENVIVSADTEHGLEVTTVPLVIRGVLVVVNATTPCAKLHCPVQAGAGSLLTVAYDGVVTTAVGLELLSCDGPQRLDRVQLEDCSMLIGGANEPADPLQEIAIETLDARNGGDATTVPPLRIDLTKAEIRIGRMRCLRTAALAGNMIQTGAASPANLHLSLGQAEWTLPGGTNAGMYAGVTNMVTSPGAGAYYNGSSVVPP